MIPGEQLTLNGDSVNTSHFIILSGSCISSCVGLSDGLYQSCLGCDVYVSCVGETLTYEPCL